MSLIKNTTELNIALLILIWSTGGSDDFEPSIILTLS
jgi:hypothetical protein